MIARLQKILAQAGVASRRAAEELIVAGRVRVNGKVARELGTKADPRADKITVDGRPIFAQRHVYYLLHKPRGTVTTLADPEGRPTVMDLIEGVPERIFPVGRLDYDSAGALLLTNDGELAHALLHPRQKVPKTYAVKLRGHPGPEALDRWREGVRLDDGITAPAEVSIIEQRPNATWLSITIREGRNRQIHRMGEAISYPVQRLTRVQFAGLSIDGLAPGELRELSGKEIARLRKDYAAGGIKTRVGAPQSKPQGPRGPRPGRHPKGTRGSGRARGPSASRGAG